MKELNTVELFKNYITKWQLWEENSISNWFSEQKNDTFEHFRGVLYFFLLCLA